MEAQRISCWCTVCLVIVNVPSSIAVVVTTSNVSGHTHIIAQGMEYFTLHDLQLRSGSYGGNRRSRTMLEIELGRCVVPEIVGCTGQPDGRPFRLLHTLIRFDFWHSARARIVPLVRAPLFPPPRMEAIMLPVTGSASLIVPALAPAACRESNNL